MEGIIINYRRGKRTQKTNQAIIIVPSITDKKNAQELVGKSVKYICEGKNKKELKGKISSAHGGKGALRVIFERGMPGQAIGKEVKIE